MPYQRRGKARAALVWGALAFVAIQLLLDVTVVARNPEIHDPEFAVRLKALRARLAEDPGRPLLMMVGSSRTQLAFMPERLPPLRTATGEQVLPFNFSHFMAGPVMNLQEVQRLLRRGIRPRWLVVEIMPPWLADSSQYLLITTAGADDFPLVRRYLRPASMRYSFLSRQLVPCYQHRRWLCRQAVPGWDAPGEWERNQGDGIGPLGGHLDLFGPDLDPARIQRYTEAARNDYSPRLRDIRVADISDRALRELIGLCRSEGIDLVLMLTPEGGSFRSWYSPQSRERINAYCDALRREYGVPLIDARDWLDDADFFDSHHVTLRGAEAFTRRCADEVFRPLVEGRLPAPPPR
jgi:hypothetical protein